MAMTSQIKAEPFSAAAVLQHWVPENHIPAFKKNISAVHFIFFWGGGGGGGLCGSKVWGSFLKS